MSTRAWKLTEFVVKAVVLTSCASCVMLMRCDTPSSHDATTMLLAALSGMATGKISLPKGE